MNNRKTEMRIAEVEYTQEDAKRILELKNEGNRGKKLSKIKEYERTMRAGAWRSDNGEGLKFSKSGRLMDGQNRLFAFIESGLKSIRFCTIYNVADSCFDTIGIGAIRNGGDMLTIYGAKDTSNMATVLKYCWQYEQGSLGKTTAPDNTKIIGLYKRHKDSYESLRLMAIFANSGIKGILPKTMAAFLHYVYSKKHSVVVTDFLKSLYTGENIESRSPVASLRNRLLTDMTSLAKTQTTIKLALCIKAINLTIDGKLAPKCLKFGKNADEKFPVIM